jgi:hypothetical protein
MVRSAEGASRTMATQGRPILRDAALRAVLRMRAEKGSMLLLGFAARL